MDLGELLAAQDALQVESFGGVSPTTLDADARIDFIHWNHTALCDELHEMLGEVGWKPWATSRHVNSEAASKELVDAFHFFMNLLLAVAPWEVASGGPQAIADWFADKYFEKRALNAKRQEEGYDGLNKCAGCKRALDDIVPEVRDTGTFCPCGALIHA